MKWSDGANGSGTKAKMPVPETSYSLQSVPGMQLRREPPGTIRNPTNETCRAGYTKENWKKLDRATPRLAGPMRTQTFAPVLNSLFVFLTSQNKNQP